jgi:hypothetical protein
MTQIYVDTLANEAGTGPTTLLKQWAMVASYSYDMGNDTSRRNKNVSSFTDNGTGSLTANYTNSLSSNDITASGATATGNSGLLTISAFSVSDMQTQAVDVDNDPVLALDEEHQVHVEADLT